MNDIPFVWIDTDTGVDDALALIAASSLDSRGAVSVVGVSTVCGNVEQEKTFENARNVLHLTGRSDIPVYPGADTPLVRELKMAKHVHGENGLGGAILAPSPAERQTEKAWDALYHCAKDLGGKLELILVGPYTNAALAFRAHPDLKRYIRRILVMGGALEGGNITPYAEFNIHADPEAAKEIFSLDIPVVMFGLDVTMKARLERSDIDEIESVENDLCRLFRESTHTAQGFYQRNTGDCYCCHDVCPVLYLYEPELFSGLSRRIDVVTEDGERLGQTVEVPSATEKERNVLVMTQVQRARFAGLIKDMLR